MSKIEFDMRISGDVEKMSGNGSLANFKMHTEKFSKKNHEDITIQEATEAVTVIAKGLISGIAPILVEDGNNKTAVEEAVKFIVGQLAIDVGIDPQALMLLSLKEEIGD